MQVMEQIDSKSGMGGAGPLRSRTRKKFDKEVAWGGKA